MSFMAVSPPTGASGYPNVQTQAGEGRGSPDSRLLREIECERKKPKGGTDEFLGWC